MGKRVADQHAVMDRGWDVAYDLASAIEDAIGYEEATGRIDVGELLAALRRYEEARNG